MDPCGAISSTDRSRLSAPSAPGWNSKGVGWEGSRYRCSSSRLRSRASWQWKLGGSAAVAVSDSRRRRGRSARALQKVGRMQMCQETRSTVRMLSAMSISNSATSFPSPPVPEQLRRHALPQRHLLQLAETVKGGHIGVGHGGQVQRAQRSKAAQVR